MLNKNYLPTISKFKVDIDLKKLRAATDKLAEKFVDVKSANPQLCMNHEELVKDVYDNFDQINLTTANTVLPFTNNIRERLRRREEHLYNIPTDDYSGSYFESIIDQFSAPSSRIRITRLAPKKTIPFHVDYDVSYAVRCICPIYGGDNVVNLFKRNNKIEAYNLQDGDAYFLNVGLPHAVVNMSDKPRIAFMFSLDGTDDIQDLINTQ